MRVTNSVLLILLCLWIARPVLSQSAYLVLDSDEYHYVATFDPSRISKEHLRELLLLSPHDLDGPWNIGGEKIVPFFMHTPTVLKKGLLSFRLEDCTDGDKTYLRCGTRGLPDPNFLDNAEINLRKNENLLSAWDSLDVASELLPVWQQYRESLLFYTTIERSRLRYLRTGDAGVLLETVGSISPVSECAQQTASLRGANSPEDRYGLSLSVWYNCVNDAFVRSSPAYPQEAWQSFLKDYGIREEFQYKAVD